MKYHDISRHKRAEISRLLGIGEITLCFSTIGLALRLSNQYAGEHSRTIGVLDGNEGISAKATVKTALEYPSPISFKPISFMAGFFR